jgi:hypothetical protein
MSFNQPIDRVRSAAVLPRRAHRHYEAAQLLEDLFTRTEFLEEFRRHVPERATESGLLSDYCFHREDRESSSHPRLMEWGSSRGYRFAGIDGVRTAPKTGRQSPPSGERSRSRLELHEQMTGASASRRLKQYQLYSPLHHPYTSSKEGLEVVGIRERRLRSSTQPSGAVAHR